MSESLYCRHASHGNTLAEYAMILGLVGVVGIASLQFFGKNSNTLAQKNADKLESQPLQQYAGFQFAALAAANKANAANRDLEASLSDGSPTVPLTSNSSSESNATSLENQKLSVYAKANENVKGSAGTLAAIARLKLQMQGLTDPKAIKLANDVLLSLQQLAVSEGASDGVPGMKEIASNSGGNRDSYSVAEATKDIWKISENLNDALKGLNGSGNPELTAIIGLTNQSLTLAKPYLSPNFNLGTAFGSGLDVISGNGGSSVLNLKSDQLGTVIDKVIDTGVAVANTAVQTTSVNSQAVQAAISTTSTSNAPVVDAN